MRRVDLGRFGGATGFMFAMFLEDSRLFEMDDTYDMLPKNIMDHHFA